MVVIEGAYSLELAWTVFVKAIISPSRCAAGRVVAMSGGVRAVGIAVAVALGVAAPLRADDARPSVPKLEDQPPPATAAPPAGDARTLPRTVAICQDGKRCWAAKVVEDCRLPFHVFRLVIDDPAHRDADAALDQCWATLKDPGPVNPLRPD